MSAPTSDAAPPRRQTLRSIWAVFAGFVFVVVISLGTDQILHVADVYPPWGEPMHQPALNALALSYRVVYGILGSYIMAALAPAKPMKHAMIGGGIGFVLSVIGAVTTIPMNIGPAWYPILLAVQALPGAWAGAALHRRWSHKNS